LAKSRAVVVMVAAWAHIFKIKPPGDCGSKGGCLPEAHICEIKRMGGSSCGWKASCLGVHICPGGCGSKAGFAFAKLSLQVVMAANIMI